MEAGAAEACGACSGGMCMRTKANRQAAPHCRQTLQRRRGMRRMFREHQLRALFTKYVKLAPLHDKEIVECVVADLKGELGVC